MKSSTKVQKFLQCIETCEGSTSPNPAILMAHSKFGLNAACVQDQDEWYEAVAIAGHPFSKRNEFAEN